MDPIDAQPDLAGEISAGDALERVAINKIEVLKRTQGATSRR